MKFSPNLERKIRLYSAAKTWAGIKGGMKGALKGAKWGAILAPGNLIAAGLGHHKTALGITAAGALIGGGIGFKKGRDSALNKYKYETDPQYREKIDKKIDKEDQEFYKKSLERSLNQDLGFSNEFSYKDWKKLSDELDKQIPKEILDYINFYERTWKKKIKAWYSYMPEKGSQFDIVEFKEIFPMPIDSETAKEWLDNLRDLVFLTVNDAGDDGWGIYNLDTKRYGWDTTNFKYETSFKKFICENVDKILKNNKLSVEQIKMAQEFKRNIK